MTRLYIQPSFLNSCEEHGLWSGGNDQYRGDRSVDLATFDKNGRARVEAFSDSAIEALKKKKTSVPLVDRVLPQQRRVRVLTEQLYELEAEKKAGLDIRTYSQLRDILIVKRDRAQVLLEKALATKPIRPENEEDEEEIHYASSSNPSDNNRHRESYSSPVGVGFFAEVVDGLSDKNSFKKILQRGCKLVRGLVRFSSATKRYIKTLQEV
jgi:hypothetical protein